jgi:exosortase H (IPTLxxWG-CTERM-specific)
VKIRSFAASAVPNVSSPAATKNRPKRFAILFAICFLVGCAALPLPPVQLIDGKFSQSLVRISGALIGICGGKASVQGAILCSPGGFAVEMKDGCNAVTVTILLWAAIVAFPATKKMKILGLIAGSLIIQVVNIIRFITLFYIGQYSATWFDFAHAYLWESLIVLDTLVVFGVWVKRASRVEGARNAEA